MIWIRKTLTLRAGILTIFLCFYVLALGSFKSYLRTNWSGESNENIDSDLKNEIEIELRELTSLPQCKCQVNLKLPKKSNKVPQYSFEDTTCSHVAFRRGEGQKIVGFSYYGDSRSEHHKEKKYFDGIMNNLKLMPLYYPGWILR